MAVFEFFLVFKPRQDEAIIEEVLGLLPPILVYNLTYFLDQKMKCLVTQKFDLDPINIDLRNGKMSKILNLEWWASQFLGLKILTLIPLNQYIFSVFLQVWCSPVSKWWLKWT